MKRKKCPECRSDTWSEKWESCSACGYKKGVTITATDEESVAITPSVSLKPAGVMAALTAMDDVVVTAGSPCPTCGKPVGKSKALLQKEYRERKKHG